MTRSFARVRRIVLTVLLLVMVAVVATPRSHAAAATLMPQAGQRDFTIRYSNNVNGQITIAANTIVKCSVNTPDASVNSACNGSRTGANARNNNSYDMQWLDYDSDPSTFDSSKADLILPPGGRVLFAGLYWTGMQVKGDVITYADGSKGVPQPAPNPSLIGQVKLRVPGSSTYATVNASTIDTGPISLGSGYGAFADVTAQVNAAGAGPYYVGNVQTGTGANAFGGWSLVVAYSDPAEPLRNLSVFDGLKIVSGSSTVTIPLTGFKTPSSGTVRTTVGVVAAEGDAGMTGDYLMVNNNRLTDAVHPANNTENSTIANRGVNVTTKGPDWANQLGYDSSLFTADGFLANGATRATFTAQTTGDVYAPQAITFATELYSPAVSLTKTADVSTARPGDVVTYTITAANTSPSAAAINTEIVDPIPAGMTLAQAPTSSGGTPWCAPSCGTPATVESVGVSLGTLLPGQSATFTVKTTVNGDRPLDEVIDNVATMTFVAPDLGLPVSKIASVPVTVAYPDPAVTKSVVTVGSTSTFTVNVQNVGTLPTSGAIGIIDDVGGTGATITAISGNGWSCGSTGGHFVTCSYAASLAPGASAPTINVTATYPNSVPVQNSAFLDAANNGGQPTSADSPALLNDISTAAGGVAPYAYLAVNKAAVLPEVSIGGSSQFRMSVRNTGPFTATNAVLSDMVPAGLEVDAVSTTQGTCSTAPGSSSTTIVTCTLGDMAVNADARVVATVSPRSSIAGTTVINAVSVTSDVSQAPATDTASLFVRQATDLSVTKIADRETVNPGDVVRYTVSVSNNGPFDAPQASITDHLPSAIASATASATGGGTCAVANGVVDCTWANLAVNSSATVTIDATIKSSFSSSVPAEVESKRAMNIVQASSAIDEIDQSDNEAAVLVKVLPYGDVAATASGPGVVAPGSSATLTFTGSNNGPTTATGTVLTIEIPSGLAIASVPPNCAVSGRSVTCDLGTLVQGASTPIDVVVLASPESAGLAYLSTVAITSSVDDPVPENNSDMTPLYSTRPPVIVSVDPGSGPPEGGTEVTITGDNLTTETTVEVGGVPCTPVWFNSAQQLVCTTGAHPPGVVDVVVRTADGQTATLVGGFTYTGDVGPSPDKPAVPKYTG